MWLGYFIVLSTASLINAYLMYCARRWMKEVRNIRVVIETKMVEEIQREIRVLDTARAVKRSVRFGAGSRNTSRNNFSQ